VEEQKKNFEHLARVHPCLGGEAHVRFGRLHLPVSPACNIQCRFCKREKNAREERPGVARGILPPEEAVDTVRRALELCPQITVVGIAGPGDTLATPHALEAFRQVHAAYPDLVLCLSTNGLLLQRYAQELWDAGVRTVTVTVNAVDPEIQEKIVSRILLDGELHYGLQAASMLIARQLSGIREMAAKGAVIKVNTVLIPGVNDAHIEDIARTVKEAGANMHNIIPLIPQHELSHIPAPTCAELNKAREAAEKHITVFRHCKHCRADACGIPGKLDLSAQLYGDLRTLETFSHG